MKLSYGLIAAGVALAMMSTPALATPTGGGSTVLGQLAHFTKCLNLMFTNPAQHAIECGPGHDVFVSGTTGYASVPKEITEPVDTGL